MPAATSASARQKSHVRIAGSGTGVPEVTPLVSVFAGYHRRMRSYQAWTRPFSNG